MFYIQVKNYFFRIALAQAARIVGKPGRLVALAARILHQLYQSNRRELNVTTIRQQFQTLGRMVTAYARGHYRAIPVKTLLSLIAALIYFLNPVDLIPDALPGLGFTDDFAVLSWVYHHASNEVNAFVAWETISSVKFPK